MHASDDQDPIKQAEALVAQGDYRAAAEIYKAQQDWGQAKRLYNKLFDYKAAGDAAREQGDDLGALEFYLKGNHLQASEQVRCDLMAELSDDLSKAMALFEARSFFLQAAELAESIGRLGRAADLYLQAKSYKRAAHLLERLGRLREAGQAYEAMLLGQAEDPDANLGLGRVLQRFGRHKEALPLLVQAMKTEETRSESSRRVAYAFFKMDLLESGRAALAHAGLPRTLDPETLMRPFEEEAQAQQANQGPGAETAGGALEGRYRIERPMGGRFGATYLGRNLLSGQTVIVRFYPGTQEENAAFFDEMETISRAAARGHVRVLEIHRSGSFVVNEFLEGDALRRRLSQAPALRVQQCRGIAPQLLEAVAQAHKVGILHGALSTTCVRVLPGGACVIDDWGARHIERRMATRTGGPESAFAYRAPELNLGREADFRADLYSVAAILFRCLRGVAPGLGQGGQGWGDWPEEFAQFFTTALEPSPNARHTSHDQFSRALRALPWVKVGKREIVSTTPGTEAQNKEESQGPRFTPDREPAPGEIVDAQDSLLERSVRLLRLPSFEQRPVRLIDRLHVIAGPEQPIFQDILSYNEAQDAIILEWPQSASIAQLITEGQLPPLERLLEAADAFSHALSDTHQAGIGLGVVDLTRTLGDGRGFRVRIEETLLVDHTLEGRRIQADTQGFWSVLCAMLGQATHDTPGPEAILQVLSAHTSISPRDAEALRQSASAVTGHSMASWPDWFAELRRSFEAHELRRTVLSQAQQILHQRGTLRSDEKSWFQARRQQLGIEQG